MRKVVIAGILLAVLGVVLLHVCPPLENWLHQVTGWH